MSIFKCKMCGGTIEFEPGATVGVCDSCGTKQTLPRLDDERRANLYDRANHFRRSNDFDKAANIYEQILADDNTDAEAYWSLVLCHYGIEYVEDPASHKRIPTVNRAQFTSIFADEDYKSALHYADYAQQELYEAEAATIDNIQKGILAISEKEEPFDVFICYKESDSNGRRTPDSVLAYDLYRQLTQEGLKVFFAGVTLEDKLGTAYEPYIFAALNSAKAMVVIGTKPEHFNAVWVKNEWSRYLALIKAGQNKVLIPAYRDMEPYDLPDEISHLQAQDMSKLGFMQDLTRGIRKIVDADKQTAVPTAKATNVTPLLERAFMFLEDGDWQSADEYCEKVLDQDPKNAQAYLGKLMAELRVHSKESLKNSKEPFDNLGNYKKALRFADYKLKAELVGYIEYINNRNESQRLEGIYNDGLQKMSKAKTEKDFLSAAKVFESIVDYKDSKNLFSECNKKSIEIKEETARKAEAAKIAAQNRAKKIKRIIPFATTGVIVATLVIWIAIIPGIFFTKAKNALSSGQYDDAITYYSSACKYGLLPDFLNAKYMASSGVYVIEADELYAEGNYKEALEYYTVAGNQLGIENCMGQIEIQQDTFRTECRARKGSRIATYGCTAFVVNDDGTMNIIGKAGKETINWCADMSNVVSISAGGEQIIGLKSDGTVVAIDGWADNNFDIHEWNNIIEVSAGENHAVGLMSDGTVVATGTNSQGQCNVESWNNIIAIAAGDCFTVGLKSDGTVVACGFSDDGRCAVEDWSDIIAISADGCNTVGLKSDGTVLAVGYNVDNQCDVSDWRDIVAIAAGTDHIVGLKADGTVVAAGNNRYKQCNIEDWNNIVYISASESFTAGLKSDGTVITAGSRLSW